MRIVAVASGKGGVGKTTIALNLVLALTQQGRNVLLVDANFEFPHVGLLLGKSNFEETLLSAVEGEKEIKETIYKHQSGLKLIPGNISLEHLHKKNIDRFNELLPELKDYAEVVFLDLVSGLHEENLGILKQCDDLLLITTPDFLSVTETLRLIKVAQQHGKNILGVIVNRMTSHSSDMKIENIQALLNQKIIGVIPEDKAVKEALRLKYPVIYSHPSSNATTEFNKIACSLIGKPYVKPKKEKQTKFMQVMEQVGLKKWYEALMEDDEE